MSQWNTIVMSPKKWIEIDTSLQMTGKKNICIPKTQIKVFAQTRNFLIVQHLLDSNITRIIPYQLFIWYIF